MTREKTQRRTGSKILALGLLLAAMMAAGLVLTKPAHARDFTVTNRDDSGAGSLRQAILDANALSGADTIEFDIPEASSKRIALDSELPSITDPVTIDGYTQPEARENTLARGATNAVLEVSLDGFDTDGAEGLVILADDVVVRGLAIGNFDRDGIQIGANNPSDGPVEPSGVEIEGNFIGPDASGTVLRRNGFNGVNSATDGEGNTIGGTTPASRNLITANSIGVNISGSEGGYVIAGNLIGTDKDGTGGGLGNRNQGVRLNAPGNTVGGASPGAANTIASNGSEGVEVASVAATGNRILGNSVFSNGALGIDLGGDGRTGNDPGDADAGPNDLQNEPVVTSTKTKKGKTTVGGKLDSVPKRTFTIQLFSNPRGEDEGKTFLGETRVTTNKKGKASFGLTTTLPAGTANVTATATDPRGNSSEFSAPKSVG